MYLFLEKLIILKSASFSQKNKIKTIVRIKPTEKEQNQHIKIQIKDFLINENVTDYYIICSTGANLLF